MSISEATRSSIVELSLRGYSQREIATEIGVSKNTVTRVLASDTVPKSVPKNGRPVTRATKGVSQKNGDKTGTLGETATSTPDNPPEVFIAPVVMTEAVAINELMNLLQEAKLTLQRARASDPPSPGTEATAIKAIQGILKLMGDWCGLDDSVKVVDVNPTIGREDVDGMDLETMRRVVRDL